MQTEQQKYNNLRAQALLGVQEAQQKIESAIQALSKIPAGYLSQYEMDNARAISDRTLRLARKLWRRSPLK